VEIGVTMHGEWEIIWNSLEEETQDTMAKCCFTFCTRFNCLDNMHLHVHELSIDRMLRWRVEMILNTM
jgi:hypothetical protein